MCVNVVLKKQRTGIDCHFNYFQNITSFNAERWTSRNNPYQLESTHFDANVTAVCLSSEDFGISFPVQAPNFYSLFFEKKILELSPQDWINGITNPRVAVDNFQDGCFEIGFNVGDENEIQARIGVVSKNNAGEWRCDDIISIMLG